MNKRDKERKLELANKKLEVELDDIHLRLLRNLGKIISLKHHREVYDEAKLNICGNSGRHSISNSRNSYCLFDRQEE